MKPTIKELPIQGKKVLIRVDFNVPLDKEGGIVDDTRIRAALPTIQYALDQKAKVILISHMGRPKGRDASLSLRPCAERLGKLLKRDCAFVDQVRGNEVVKRVSAMKEGDLLLLENLRYEPAEEKPEKDPSFAKELAGLVDFYVDDAFGAAHRSHSSITEVPKSMKGRSAIGFLMKEEVDHLERLFQEERPFLALVGGAKVSSKIEVLKTLVKEVDGLLIGGAMAFTFLKAKGYAIGKSLFEEEFVAEAAHLLEKYSSIFLPVDVACVEEIKEGAPYRVFTVKEGIPPGWQGVDIGPQTIEKFCQQLSYAKTVFWNGPLGICEVPPFDKGTSAIAKRLSEVKGYKVVGGGDSIAAIEKMGLAKGFSFLSTGGGASLEFLEQKTLPGLAL